MGPPPPPLPTSPSPSPPPAPPTVIPPQEPSQKAPTPTQKKRQKRKWEGAHTLESVGDAALLDEAWSDTSISQVDGAMDTPLERPGRTVEVEGRLEVGKESMTGWSQVRRKKGQGETDVVAGSGGVPKEEGPGGD